MSVLKAEALCKIYSSGKGQASYKALQDFNIAVEAGEFVGVMGPSGSGKTTLLNLLATIDSPTSGKIEIGGMDPSRLTNRQLALFRRRQLGFIFQDFNLLDTLSIEENIMLPLVLENTNVRYMKNQTKKMAEMLNITSILPKRTFEVSGGQQQRAAIARAMIHKPAMILADELTGNLDSKAAHDVMRALEDLNELRKATILMVTHDPFAASFCHRIVFIRDGQLFSEIRKGAVKRQTFFQQILDALSVLGGNFDEISSIRS